MRTYPLRVFVSLIAVFALLFANAAVAQDEVEIPQTQEECEESGRTWVPENAWDMGYDASCAPGLNEEWGPGDTVGVRVGTTPAEPVQPEPAPTAQLPRSQPAPAQQGAPQYTG